MTHHIGCDYATQEGTRVLNCQLVNDEGKAEALCDLEVRDGHTHVTRFLASSKVSQGESDKFRRWCYHQAAQSPSSSTVSA